MRRLFMLLMLATLMLVSTTGSAEAGNAGDCHLIINCGWFVVVGELSENILYYSQKECRDNLYTPKRLEKKLNQAQLCAQWI